MLLLPAIDLKDGLCVRLYQGDMNAVTVFSKNPVEIALKWEAMGAKMLHLVDLDGACAGAPKNLQVVKDIIAAINIPVQLGGGIRSLESIELLLQLGVKRVILGTAAINNPEMVAQAVEKFGSEAILVGIDGKHGQVAVDGWENVTEKSIIDLAMEIKELGVKTIIYTDISRDGTLQGINAEGIKEIAEATGLRIIASGGVANINDLIKLKLMEALGVEALIIGKALYTGDLDLQEALKIAEGDR